MMVNIYTWEKVVEKRNKPGFGNKMAKVWVMVEKNVGNYMVWGSGYSQKRDFSNKKDALKYAASLKKLRLKG